MEQRSYHYDDNRFIRIFYYYCYCYYVTQRSPLRNDIFCKHYFRALIFIASPSPRECHLFLSFSFESILDDVARSSPTVRSSYAPFPPQPMLLDLSRIRFETKIYPEEGARFSKSLRNRRRSFLSATCFTKQIHSAQRSKTNKEKEREGEREKEK